jgi:hypothetical protein
MIDRGANGGIAGSDTRRSATLVVLLMLLGLMITSSLHLYRFGRSSRLYPSGTRHRYPESIRMVSSRRHVHSFIWPDGTFWQHRRRSLNGRNGRQHVVTMGDYIMTLLTVFLTPAPATEEWRTFATHHLDFRLRLGSTVLDSKISNKTDWHLATQMPPDRPSFPTGTWYTDRTDIPTFASPSYGRGDLQPCLRARQLERSGCALRWSTGDVWLGGPDPDDEDLSEWGLSLTVFSKSCPHSLVVFTNYSHLDAAGPVGLVLETSLLLSTFTDEKTTETSSSRHYLA